MVSGTQDCQHSEVWEARGMRLMHGFSLPARRLCLDCLVTETQQADSSDGQAFRVLTPAPTKITSLRELWVRQLQDAARRAAAARPHAY